MVDGSSERTALLRDSIASNTIEDGEQTGASSRPIQTSLPWRSVSAIFCLCAVQPLVFELIFPFINQMILEIGVVDDPERVGFYSGVIESLFACMSFICIVPLTYVSNRYGRKPVVLLAISSIAFSVALFGMSKTYWFMILTRLIGGGGGGGWATMKVMLAELTDKSNQATAFTGLSISYRIGQSIGQPIGGLLAHPERRSKLFDTPFWREYPFSLPCFVSAGAAGIFVVFGYFTLDETLPRKQQRIPSGTLPCATDSDQDLSSLRRSRSRWQSVINRRTASVLFSVAAMFFIVEIMFAIYPLFAFTPVTSGGLGLSEAAIGAHTAFRALTSILVIFAYAPLQRRLGTVGTYQLSLFIWPFTVMFLPALNFLARHGQSDSVLFKSLLVSFFFVWSFASLGLPSQAIMITDAAQSPESLSTLMSISQMTISFIQAISPAFITSLFAFSLKTEHFGSNLTWVIMLVLTCIAAIHSLGLEESTHDWRKDRVTD
ncbi:MFS general substrate transporter [Schizopora paradoxa]|uniref:MFS general substrate transporter n=1 Tax=Schizopora paradoxa TaxID=27342 RepID=A0A0H2RAU9_9AGAM|nr:MFS general substrate transporter [Schizopora paradoxa]